MVADAGVKLVLGDNRERKSGPLSVLVPDSCLPNGSMSTKWTSRRRHQWSRTL